MDKDELLLLLNLLIKAPGLVKKVTENGLDTEFGYIETGCLGSCVNITLHNGITTSVDVVLDEEKIKILFNSIRESATKFGIFILLDKMKKCYDVLNSTTNSNQSS